MRYVVKPLPILEAEYGAIKQLVTGIVNGIESTDDLPSLMFERTHNNTIVSSTDNV